MPSLFPRKVPAAALGAWAPDAMRRVGIATPSGPRLFTTTTMTTTTTTTKTRRWCSSTPNTANTPGGRGGHGDSTSGVAPAGASNADALTRAASSAANGAEYTSVQSLAPWQEQMLDKYGSAFHLLRPVYRDLVDEMRHEVFARPPAPLPGWLMLPRNPEDHHVCFHRVEDDGTEIVVGAPIVVRDPEHKNEVLSIISWFELTVLMLRNGAIVEANVAALEGGLQVRNVKCYRVPRWAHAVDFMRFDKDSIERRVNMYDGPYVHHMEQYVMQELYDVLMDHGVDNDLVRYVAEWVFYLDHVAFTRWSLDLLSHLGGVARVETEADLLTAEERDEFEFQAEEWMPLKKM